MTVFDWVIVIMLSGYMSGSAQKPTVKKPPQQQEQKIHETGI